MRDKGRAVLEAFAQDVSPEDLEALAIASLTTVFGEDRRERVARALLRLASALGKIREG